MAGRKPQPTHLKVVRGNRGRRPLPKDEPQAATGKPEPPAWLSPRAGEIFAAIAARLEELGLASSSHTEMLALLAQRLLEVETCAALLAEHGSTYVNARSGVWRKRPEVAMLAEASRHAQSLLAEFGLSPAAASKVGAPGKKKKNPYEALP